MDFGNLLWLVFIFFALQPVIASGWLKAMRASKFANIQKKRNSRVIAVIHRQEAMRLLGFPIARYIDMDDAEQVLYAIRTTPADQPIDLILHTPGGLVIAAVQIARAVRTHPGRAALVLPEFAIARGT